jgi:hypothetical protein
MRIFLMVALLPWATPSAAQTPREALVELLHRGAMLKGDATSVVAVLEQQATTLPIGTSSGGFTWDFDSALGIVVRRSQSFGPIFSDRALTIGRRKASVAVTTQHTTWRSLAGQRLASDGLFGIERYTDAGIFTDDLQFIEERYGSRIDLQTDRTTFNVTCGVTSRLDVNAIVPFGRTSVDGTASITVTLLQLSRVVINHAQAFSAAAAGLGDVGAGAKYLALSRKHLALAAAGELRFPTGKAESLLGAGKAREKISAIGTFTLGRYNPHVEIGRTFAGAGLGFNAPRFGPPEVITVEPSNEINWSSGMDVTVTPRFTIAGDVLGRTLQHAATIIRTESVRPFFGPYTTDNFGFRAVPSDVSLRLAAIGGKVLVGSSWLLTGSVLFPLNDAGLKPGITPVIGFERSF